MHGTVVCGVLDGAEARSAAELASALAARLDLRLVLVHVAAAAGLNDGLGPVLEGIGLDQDDVEARIVVGNRVDALARVAAEEGADLIVLGSRARGARGRQLRCSLACELEAAQAVPVLIAPPATRRRSSRRLALADVAAGR